MISSKHKQKLAIIAIISLVVFIWLNWFPPGDLGDELAPPADTGLYRNEAAAPAIDFLEEQVGKGDWQTFTSFNQYADAMGYFTKEKLTAAYDEHWSSLVPFDYYQVGAHLQGKPDRYLVFVKSTDGAVFGWEAIEQSAGLRINPEDALRLLGYEPTQFKTEESTSGLVYNHAVHISEAALRIEVKLDGAAVLSIKPIIALPDDYLSWKNTQDQKGALTSALSLLLWFGLAVAAIVYAAVYRAEMSFSRGIWLSLAFLIPYITYNVNMYPAMKLEDGAVFLVLFSQFLIMLLAITVYLCLVAGDGLWRKMGFELWTSHRAPGFKNDVMRAVGLGYVYCVIIMGLQSTIFSIGAELFDVWFGSDPMMSSNNLLWPALYPLLAWSAAISEEAVYRIFAIAFFTVLIRPLWRWVARWTSRPIFLHPLFYLVPAITIANVLWALGHTGYSIYPVYTRLVEVAILGFVFSFIFLRYGLIAAIFTHATMDLVIMGLDIMSSGSRYVGIGLFYMFMPLLVGLLIRWYSNRWARRRPPAITADGPVSP